MNIVGKRTVVVTGASSGIGKASVMRLVQSGWQVFATVRKVSDGERLQSKLGAALVPVILDVTDATSIAGAAEQVSSQLQGGGLDGLVNVAGVGRVRPVAYMSAGDLRGIFEINVFGQIAVTQAFVPELRRARGRIVNISSVGAHIAIPFGSLINASKAAFGIFSDTMRMELRPFGIRVATIEPAAIATPAVDKTLGNIEKAIASLPPAGSAEYGDMLREFARRAYAQEMKGSSADVVAAAVHHALTSPRPRARYRVGKHARVLTTLPRILPDALLEHLLMRIAGMPTQFGANLKETPAELRHRPA